jgi:heparin binding hemagglutinin HbhA
VIDMPTIDDVRKAGEQARVVVTSAFEQARTPLLAAIGVGEVATQAVIDAVTKARTQVNDLPTDVTELRGRLDPTELRKLVDQYTEAAWNLYQYLTEHGEETLAKLRNQPQVKRAVEQFDQAAQAAQHRAESAVEDARELADEVLGRVVRRARSTGEETGQTVESVADEAAETVHEAGKQAAHQVRSATRKTAGRASGGRASGGTTTTRKTTTARSTRTGK